MKKILIAEDDKFLSNAYHIKLTKMGFDVTVVGDGEQVMRYLKDTVPDLILLDLIMPIKDGFDTLRDIRSQTKFNKIPIIISSNLGQGEDIKKATEMGATDYFVKSDMSLQSLVEKIASNLASQA